MGEYLGKSLKEAAKVRLEGAELTDRRLSILQSILRRRTDYLIGEI